MKYVILVSRLLLGLMFFVFGLNGILHFLKMPAMPPSDATTWSNIMVAHGWMTFVAVIMVISGLLLLVGRFVPLALTMLAPVIVNILLFHALLQHEGFQLGALAALLEIILLIAYYRTFAPLFIPDPKPTTPNP
jgi:putative oxidoreductase